jgi:hypothetical protein
VLITDLRILSIPVSPFVWDCKGKRVFNESKEKLIFNVQSGGVPHSMLDFQVIDIQ